ncbi:hypothetical protein [Taibaiella chishuiensis]|nr:hypothetical protein [Taibaiella chishuiensis]
MKRALLTLALAAGALFTKAQTTTMHVQNRNACIVGFQFIGGDCGNTQSVTYSTIIPSPAGVNTSWPLSSIPWMGPPPPGIIGVRVYNDYTGCSPAYTDIFIPTGGPTPLFGPPVIPMCTSCPPINTFFEIYCGQPVNYVMFF